MIEIWTTISSHIEEQFLQHEKIQETSQDTFEKIDLCQLEKIKREFGGKNRHRQKSIL